MKQITNRTGNLSQKQYLPRVLRTEHYHSLQDTEIHYNLLRITKERKRKTSRKHTRPNDIDEDIN